MFHFIGMVMVVIFIALIFIFCWRFIFKAIAYTIIGLIVTFVGCAAIISGTVANNEITQTK